MPANSKWDLIRALKGLSSTEHVLYKITGNIIVCLPKEHSQWKLKQEGTCSMLWQLYIIFYFAWDMKYRVLYSGTVLRLYAGHFIMSDMFFFFFCGATTQRGAWPPHSWGFIGQTQRPTTVGRTPLDEWSDRRIDLYLTTHNTHNRQISMPPVRFEPTISAGERPQTYALDRAATGTGNEWHVTCPKYRKPKTAARYEIWGSHIGVAGDTCDAISTGKEFPTFRKIVASPSSGSTQSKTGSRVGRYW